MNTINTSLNNLAEIPENISDEIRNTNKALFFLKDQIENSLEEQTKKQSDLSDQFKSTLKQTNHRISLVEASLDTIDMSLAELHEVSYQIDKNTTVQNKDFEFKKAKAQLNIFEKLWYFIVGFE